MAPKLIMEEVRTWDKEEFIAQIKGDIERCRKLKDPVQSVYFLNKYCGLLLRAQNAGPWIPENKPPAVVVDNSQIDNFDYRE